MDQIYIPKNRANLPTGSYVLIQPLKTKQEIKKHYFHDIKDIEPIKITIINEIAEIIQENHIIFTGSFLEKGFNFNDIDILIITKKRQNIKELEKSIKNTTGIRPHIIQLTFKELSQGFSTDPLYQMMLSKYISTKRLIIKTKRRINYKILDLHLLKSKTLTENFDYLTGNEKYYLIRNMISILLFLENKKITKNLVDKEIENIFKIKTTEIKQNLINKQEFLKTYKTIYKKTFNKILKNAPKQK